MKYFYGEWSTPKRRFIEEEIPVGDAQKVLKERQIKTPGIYEIACKTYIRVEGKKLLSIAIYLEEDEKTINLVDINGRNHYMFDELPEEKERYLNMTVAEFIEEYVRYYYSIDEE